MSSKNPHNDNIKVRIDDELHEIRNEIGELKDLLQKKGTDNFQYAEKIYNIKEITNAQFNSLTEKKSINIVLVTELTKCISRYHPRIANFIEQENNKLEGDWSKDFDNRMEGRKHISESFIWLVRRKLEKLFKTGDESLSLTNATKYLKLSFEIYRISMKLVSFVLLSDIWELIRKNTGLSITTYTTSFSSLMTTTSMLSEKDHFDIFISLLKIYQQEKLALPIEEIDDLQVFLDQQGSFYKTCTQLNDLKQVLNKSEVGLNDCTKAEELLSIFLCHFSFLANYQLLSMRNIEYTQQRNGTFSYIRDFTVIGRTNGDHRIRYSKDPVSCHAVYFIDKQLKKAINLFPFVVDRNALINAEQPDMCVFECIATLEVDNELKKAGLVFEFPDKKLSEDKRIAIYLKGILQEGLKTKRLSAEEKLDMKVDNVILEYSDALKTVLNIKDKFYIHKEEQLADYDILASAG